MNYKERLRQSMIVMLLPIVSYGLLGPLEIYFGNTKDFSFQYTDFLGIFVSFSVAFWLISSLILALFPEKVHRILSGTILGLGVASYIQNMFMNIKLSESDGSPMRWEELGSFPIINLIIWIVIVVAVLCISIFVKKHWTMISMGTAGFLSAIQLVAVISLLIPAMLSEKSVDNLQLATEEQFDVAPNENIVIFVLDTFGNTQYEQALLQYPEMAENLSDFTYYNNADCQYYCTFPSMTHMLTGNELDFDAYSEDWMADSWNSEKATSFYDTLHEQGYTCNLYSASVGYVYGELDNLYGKFDNVRSVDITVDQYTLVKKLAKMSIYRYVPYVMKPCFEVLTKEFDTVLSYAEGDVYTDDNGEFYKALQENSLQINRKMDNLVVVQHLFGTHKPYTLDENAQIVEEAEVNDTVKGLNVIVTEYLNQMRELGVYDNATIIITADHGSWHGGDPQPIFFMKKSGEIHEEMQVNTAPISLNDMQATILDVLEEDYSEYGTSVFDWEEGQERERTVYMRMTDENYPEVPGSLGNVYYQYTYYKDKTELLEKVNDGPEDIIPQTPWHVGGN